jgi:hypothetical protein
MKNFAGARALLRSSRRWRPLAVAFAVIVLLANTLPSVAAAQAAISTSASQAHARTVLMDMARFLAAAPHFSVRIDSTYDVVQKSGEKIEFAEARRLTVNRPDRLRMETTGSDGSRRMTVFNGSEIVLVDATAQVYAVTPQPRGLDNAVTYFVGELGIRLPLALLLMSNLPETLGARIQSLDYVERTDLYGAPAHHIAARTATADVQMWVTDGAQPLPRRVVITYKRATGQPQFRATLSDWNLDPAIDDATFTLAPPEAAQKVAFAAQVRRLAREDRLRAGRRVK